jgi:hypothetical protein
MNKIYLVCTRSALSASALTYIINQSPDFYNVCHYGLWLSEEGDSFGTASTINDYWNIPNEFHAYNKHIRNSNELFYDQLHILCDNFNRVIQDKNIALFTHASNILKINQIIADHNLPIELITTQFGHNSHHFVGNWAKREYNYIMSKWTSARDACEKLLYELTIHDKKYEHPGHIFSIQDWLITPTIVYDKLDVSQNKNIKLWVDQYFLQNNIELVEDISWTFDPNKVLPILQTFTYLINNIKQHSSDTNEVILYGKCLIELTFIEQYQWDEANNEARKRLGFY